jgi:alkyldihydroxyacetonephosphate synthase
MTTKDTAVAMLEHVLAALTTAVGEANVSTGVADRMANARGVWPVALKRTRLSITQRDHAGPPMPGCVVWPGNTGEVSAILRIAQEWRVPVVPVGGGSGIVGGTVATPGCISLDTKRLDRLRIDPISGVAFAQAGIVGFDLEQQLNEAGFSAGQFPQSFFSSTVGGWVATRASGTFSTLHGNIEDRVIGLEVVLPGGEEMRVRPTPRSATGPKLAELFLGSEGTLGVITEVALWVHPVAEHRVWASYAFPSFHSGLDAVRAFIQGGARPGVVRLYDAGETSHKFSTLCHPPETSLLVLVYEGARALVAANSEVADRACLAAGGTDLGPEPALLWWRTRFDTSGLIRANSSEGGYADAIEVAACWNNLPAVYAAMMRVADHHGAHAYAHVSHVYPSGGGLYVIFSARADDDEIAISRYQLLVDSLLSACHEAGGSISHHHGIGQGKAGMLPAEYGESGMTVLRMVKRALDPHGIMNPGVLGLGG